MRNRIEFCEPLETKDVGWRLKSLTGTAFVVGILWRFWYLFIEHPATQYIYSDMKVYVQYAKLWLDPNFSPSIYHTFHPPGVHLYFAYLYHFDPSWKLAVTVQWLISCFIPPLLAALANDLYDRRTAYYTLILSSFYFPFIDYASYFLAENPFTFCLIFASWLCVLGLKSKKSWHIFIFSLGSGIVWGVAISFKNHALASALAVLAGLCVVAFRNRSTNLCIVMSGMTLGLLLLIAPMSLRCTKINGGKFCLISTNWSANILYGHYGNLRTIRWNDQKISGATFAFTSPSNIQHGYTESLTLPFGIYENHKNLSKAWGWVSQHPLGALALSVEHVLDLFTGALPWPSVDTSLERLMECFEQLFLIGIFLPAVFYCFRIGKKFKQWDGAFGRELILILPILGLMGAVFFSIGEVRYRIPYDGFLMLLAIRCFSKENRNFLDG